MPKTKRNNDKAKITVNGEVIGEAEKCQDCGEPLSEPKLEHGQLVSECLNCGATYVSK